MEIQQVHSLASTSASPEPLQTGMSADELDEPPCSSSIKANELDVEIPDFKHISTPSLSPSKTTTSKAENVFEESHDEQTLIMMITEVENEPTESDQHQILKRKSDLGVLEIDLPSSSAATQIYKSPAQSTTEELESAEVSPVKVDEPMDALIIDTKLQSTSSKTTSPSISSIKSQQSPIKQEKTEEEKQIEVRTQKASKATETSPKPLEVLMEAEATTSTSTQTGSFSPVNTVEVPKQPSPMDTSQSSPTKLTEASENVAPPIMPRHLSTNALLIPPPRPPKTKAKRSRPPNLPPIQPISQESIMQAMMQTRVVETLRLRVEQIRNLQFTPLTQFEQPVQQTTSSSKKNSNPSLEPTPLSSVLRIHIKIDGNEVFQSTAVPTRENCVLSEEFFDTLPPNFQSVQIILVETIDGRITRQLGRKSLKRRELTSILEQDSWIPINPPLSTPIPGQPHLSQQPVCETLGQLCLDIYFDEATKELELRVLDCTAWKRNGITTPGHVANTTKRPSSQHLDSLYAPNPAVTNLHSQLNAQRSLPSSELYNLGSTSSLIQRNPRDTQLSSPLLTKKSAKFSLSPKLSRKNRHSQQQLREQQKLTGSLSSGFERKRPPSLGSQPLSRPQSPTQPDYGTPAISNSIPSTSHQEIYGNISTSAPPIHQRLTIPLTPTTVDPILKPSLCIRVSSSSEPDIHDSTCYGNLHIELNPHTMLPIDQTICGPNWYSLKTRSKQPITGSLCATVAVQPTASTSVPKPPNQQVDKWASNGATVGEMKLRWSYNMEALLPSSHYESLYSFLTTHLKDDFNCISPLTLIQQLPITLEEIAPPLMKIFVHAQKLKPFFRLLCVDYMAHSNFRDANTLFRSQSMVSKSMYDMMKFVGHDYLVYSLKPLIDLIYAKRECCEIDPARLKAGDILESNQRRLMIYVELAFSCVVESSNNCPLVMREVFAELRSVVSNFFPQREDIERLAVSSFLIMRFFSAAILNPKIFGLRREAPEPDVMRTLVLISKVLQRLANCVVSEKPLTTKEEWLTPILERVSDPAHKQQMVKFLDAVSQVGMSSEPMTPPSPVLSASPPLIEDSELRSSKLKDGHMIERRTGSDKKRSFKNLIHQKRRFVTLTETELTWQKVKESEDLEPKGTFAVADIRSVKSLAESKHSFCVGTLNSEVHFQANSTADMNEWMILIEKQQLRYMMINSRSRTFHNRALKIDLDRELETLYSILEKHLDLFCSWRQALEKRQPISFGKDAPTSLDKLAIEAKSAAQQEHLRLALQDTVCRLIGYTQQIQKAHQKRGKGAQKMIQASKTTGSPLGSPTALLARSMDYQARVFASDSNPPTPTSPVTQEFPQKDQVNVVLVDSENYLHLRSSGCKRVRKAPSTNLYDSSNKLGASVTSLGPPPKSPTA
ncbi:PH domain protein [Aphelenchoides bicaudatus]|nr:PH domain protein [Aphelenchoides bicaudatus]